MAHIGNCSRCGSQRQLIVGVCEECGSSEWSSVMFFAVYELCRYFILLIL